MHKVQIEFISSRVASAEAEQTAAEAAQAEIIAELAGVEKRKVEIAQAVTALRSKATNGEELSDADAGRVHLLTLDAADLAKKHEELTRAANASANRVSAAQMAVSVARGDIQRAEIAVQITAIEQQARAAEAKLFEAIQEIARLKNRARMPIRSGSDVYALNRDGLGKFAVTGYISGLSMGGHI